MDTHSGRVIDEQIERIELDGLLADGTAEAETGPEASEADAYTEIGADYEDIILRSVN